MRMDKCYSPILIESIKLLLGVNGKLCTYRHEDSNRFFGILQGFDLINILSEFEIIFKKIFDGIHGKQELQVEKFDFEEDLKELEQRRAQQGAEDSEILIETSPVIQKRLCNSEFLENGRDSGEQKPESKIYVSSDQNV